MGTPGARARSVKGDIWYYADAHLLAVLNQEVGIVPAYTFASYRPATSSKGNAVERPLTIGLDRFHDQIEAGVWIPLKGAVAGKEAATAAAWARGDESAATTLGISPGALSAPAATCYRHAAVWQQIWQAVDMEFDRVWKDWLDTYRLALRERLLASFPAPMVASLSLRERGRLARALADTIMTESMANDSFLAGKMVEAMREVQDDVRGKLVLKALDQGDAFPQVETIFNFGDGIRGWTERTAIYSDDWRQEIAEKMIDHTVAFARTVQKQTTIPRDASNSYYREQLDTIIAVAVVDGLRFGGKAQLAPITPSPSAKSSFSEIAFLVT